MTYKQKNKQITYEGLILKLDIYWSRYCLKKVEH